MVTMSAVWDRTTEFLSDNAGTVLTVAGLALFVPSAVQGILQPLVPTVGPGARIGLSLLSMACSAISLWGQLALIALALDPALDSGAAFRSGAARFWALVGVGLILAVLILALVVPVVVLMAAGGVDFSAMATGVAPNLDPGFALIITIYLIVAVVTVIWLLARLAVLSPVIFAERRGIGALQRSFALTRGLALRIIGVMILFGVVAIVAVLAAKTVFGSVLRIAFGDEGAINVASVLTAVVVALITTAAAAIAAAFFAKLYVAVVGRADSAAA